MSDEQIAKKLFEAWASEGNDDRTWESLGKPKQAAWLRVVDILVEMPLRKVGESHAEPNP